MTIMTNTTDTTDDTTTGTPDLAVAGVIDTTELQRMRLDDPTVRILDVRTGGEFESVHIPGSYNVPLDRLGEHARELAAVDRPIVLVCQSGGRATQAHGKLESAGKRSLHVLDGGLASWQSAGGDVVRGETTRWAMDRQVRLVAGSIALAGILASTVVPKAKWVAGGIGAGLTFSAISNTCAMGNVLARLPYNRTDSCDIEAILTELNAAA